jgi:hypothetical protein
MYERLFVRQKGDLFHAISASFGKPNLQEARWVCDGEPEENILQNWREYFLWMNAHPQVLNESSGRQNTAF